MKALVKPGWPTSCPIAAMYSANISAFVRDDTRDPLAAPLSGFHSRESSFNIDTGGTAPAVKRKK
jgi:hypothetical protein